MTRTQAAIWSYIDLGINNHYTIGRLVGCSHCYVTDVINGRKGKPREKLKSEVECICPKCRMTRKVLMHYVDVVKPRIFCSSCDHLRTSMAYAEGRDE